MFQYGREATTTLAGLAGAWWGSRVSPTSSAPASTSASHTTPANRRAGRRPVPAPLPELAPVPAPLPELRPLRAPLPELAPVRAPLLMSRPARRLSLPMAHRPHRAAAAALLRPAAWSSMTAPMMSSSVRAGTKPTRSRASVQSGTRRSMSS